MQRLGNLKLCHTLCQIFHSHRHQELLKRTRMQCHIFHPSHRERDMPSHQALQQRTCCYHIQVWSLLIKIAQCLYRLWFILNFIYENQGTLVSVLLFFCLKINTSQQVFERIIRSKQFCCFLLF